MTAQRARERRKSSHRARDVLPRKCCLWTSYLQRSMDPRGGRKTIPIDIEKDVNGLRPIPKYRVGLQLLKVNLFSTALFYHDWDTKNRSWIGHRNRKNLYQNTLISSDTYAVHVHIYGSGSVCVARNIA